MLQEEFDHPIRNALALVSAVHHYYHNEGLYRPEPPIVDENEVEHCATLTLFQTNPCFYVSAVQVF